MSEEYPLCPKLTEGGKIMADQNQLMEIVEQSGLEKTKADYILENFTKYFSVAAEWEKRAKEIIVTDESQKEVMAMARIGRLALREKRITLEKERKKLKEQALREGKAIDGIANVLKALIVPIEEYLDKQEHFVEYKKAEEERLAKIEAEKKAEEERIAKEKAEAEERERIRIENERLKKEAEEKEKQMKAEREEAEKKQREIEEAAIAERKKQEQILAKEKAKVEAERRAAQERERVAAEKARAEKEKYEAELKAKVEAERRAAQERERVEQQLKNIVVCPKCGFKFKHVGDCV